MTSYAFRRKMNLSLLATFLILVGCAFVFTPSVYAAETVIADPSAGQYTTAWVCIAAAVAFGLGALGARSCRLRLHHCSDDSRKGLIGTE